MRLLLDQNLCPLLAEQLVAAGHDAVHVRSLGMSPASDVTILDEAAAASRVLVSVEGWSVECRPVRLLRSRLSPAGPGPRIRPGSAVGPRFSGVGGRGEQAVPG